MKKKLLVSVLIGLFVIVLSGSAMAWSGRADIEGSPAEFKPGDNNGYYVWHDGHGFHIWTSARWQGHVFSGVIKTDGRFVNVRGNRLESGDSYRVNNDIKDNWFEARHGSANRFSSAGRDVSCDNAAIRFKFDTARGSDGLNFKTSNANYVEFELFIDGKPAARRAISLGDESWHPRSYNFKVFRIVYLKTLFFGEQAIFRGWLVLFLLILNLFLIFKEVSKYL